LLLLSLARAAAAQSESETELLSFEETATAEAARPEVTRRTVDTETIRTLPGTRGDALRGIEVLPGVARTNVDGGDPILRGAAGFESETLLNGTPVPFLYHFGGLTSFLSTRFVGKLDLYPGNYPVRYGRAAGGVLDVRVKDPESPRLRAAVDLSLIDSAAFTEFPIGESTNVAAAVRRSNIDFFFENVVPDDTFSVVAAPLYYDYQALVVHRLSEATRLRVMAYGSRDSIKLFFADPVDEDPALAGNIDGHLAFHRLNVELESEPSPAASLSLSLTIGAIDLAQHIGPLEQVFHGPEAFARAEASFELSSNLRTTVGLDVVSLFAYGRYHGPYPGQLEGEARDDDPLGSTRNVSDEIDPYSLVQPALYAEIAYRPIPELLIAPGARLDYFYELRHVSLDPRLAPAITLSRPSSGSR
jgi:hypothetical protein